MISLVSTRTLSCFPAGHLSVNTGGLGLLFPWSGLATSLLWATGGSCQSIFPAAYFSSLLRSLNCCTNLLCSAANCLFCPVLLKFCCFVGVWTCDLLDWRTSPACINFMTKCGIKQVFYFLLLILKLTLALFFCYRLKSCDYKEKVYYEKLLSNEPHWQILI